MLCHSPGPAIHSCCCFLWKRSLMVPKQLGGRDGDTRPTRSLASTQLGCSSRQSGSVMEEERGPRGTGQRSPPGRTLLVHHSLLARCPWQANAPAGPCRPAVLLAHALFSAAEENMLSLEPRGLCLFYWIQISSRIPTPSSRILLPARHCAPSCLRDGDSVVSSGQKLRPGQGSLLPPEDHAFKDVSVQPPVRMW